MDQVIGRCGNCGGNVTQFFGPWYGVTPPPGPKCQSCGWVPAWTRPTIPMVPPAYSSPGYTYQWPNDWQKVTSDDRRMDKGAVSLTHPVRTETTTTEAVGAAMNNRSYTIGEGGNVSFNGNWILGATTAHTASSKDKR